VFTLFETNRLAALKSPRSRGNLIGAESNTVGLAAGLATLANGRESEPVRSIEQHARGLSSSSGGAPAARDDRAQAASVLLEALRQSRSSIDHVPSSRCVIALDPETSGAIMNVFVAGATGGLGRNLFLQQGFAEGL
jgi:hypothetical protein